jgi:transposase, IS30 family
MGIRAIATGLGRCPSTVSREICRNRDEGTRAYHPYRAGRHAAGRRARPRRGKLAHCLELRAFVTGCLERRWSPEQVSAMLRRRFPGRPEMRAAPETIYRALYAVGPDRLQSGRERLLRSRRLHRKRRRRPGERLGRSMAPMVMIGQRPAEVAARAGAGH